jgi:hypothetical protein
LLPQAEAEFARTQPEKTSSAFAGRLCPQTPSLLPRFPRRQHPIARLHPATRVHAVLYTQHDPSARRVTRQERLEYEEANEI